MNPAALAVIIGRAGSKGLPNKNSLDLAGRPMVCYAVADALAARMVDRVLCSTDGTDIANAAASAGAEIIERPAELAEDNATVDTAVRHAVKAADTTHEIIVILYANVPIRPADLIDRAIKMLVETGADSVQSFSDIGKYHPNWMVHLNEQGRVHPHAKNKAYRRQDLPKLFIPDGGVIAVRRNALFTTSDDDPHAFLGRDRRGIELPAGSIVDVDDPHDFALAESILNQRFHAAEAAS